MKNFLTSLVCVGLLSLATAQAADLYINSKKVAKSANYTGSTGAASLRPTTSRQWIESNRGGTTELAISNFGFLIEDPALNKLLYGIGNRLLAHWPGTIPPAAIFVQGDGSPLLYGAATTQAQEIFIRYGVLLHAESEDELAAVVAHELGHVLLEHGKTLDYKKDMQTALQTAEDAGELYATARALEVDSATKNITLDPAIEKSLKRTAEQKIVANQLYTSVHATVYSRAHEIAADQLALDLLVAAGYSPAGIKNSLERMAHSHALSTEVSSFFEASSKAMLEDTLQAVQQYTDENGIQSAQLSQFMNNSQDQLKDSALDFGKSALKKFSSSSHPVPRKRVKKLTAYLYDSYSRSVRRRQPDAASASQFREGAIGAVVQNYSAANQAIEIIGYGDLDAAKTLTENALGKPTNNDAYTNYAAFMYGRSANDTKSALRNLQSIDADSLVPIFASVEMADMLAFAGETSRLSALVDKSESLFGPVEEFFPAKISLALAVDDQLKVQNLASQCFAVDAASKALVARCAEVSGINPPEGTGSPLKSLGNLFKPKN